MVTFRTVRASAVILIGATFAAPAVASPTVVDQYTEQIPTAGGQGPGKHGGSKAGSKKGSDGPNASGEAFPPTTTELLLATTETGSAGNSPGGRNAGPGGSAAENGVPAGSQTPAAVEPTDGQSTVEVAGSGASMGKFFPLVLLLIAGATVAAVLKRHRPGARTDAG